jgi:hypothetical protein
LRDILTQPVESRDSFISFGKARLRTEGYIKRGFDTFKAKQKYSLSGDALNYLLDYALTLLGFIPKNSSNAVTHCYPLNIAPWQGEIAAICQANGLTKEEAVEEIFKRGVEDCRITGWEVDPPQAQAEARQA